MLILVTEDDKPVTGRRVAMMDTKDYDWIKKRDDSFEAIAKLAKKERLQRQREELFEDD